MTDHTSTDSSRHHHDGDQADEVEARLRIVAGLRVALLAVETYRRLRQMRPAACRDTVALAVITARDPQQQTDAELAAAVRAIHAEQEREAEETATQLAAQVAARSTGGRVVQS